MLKFHNRFSRFCKISFRYNGIPQVNIINKKRLFSTSTTLTNSSTKKITDHSPPLFTLSPTFSESFPDTLPESLPTNDVNFIISFNQSILEFMHNSTGLPWCTTILISTILLRIFLTLPIAIIQQKSGAKMLSLQPQIMEIFEKLKHEVVREVKKRNGTYEEFQSELTKRVGYNNNDFSFSYLLIFKQSLFLLSSLKQKLTKYIKRINVLL